MQEADSAATLGSRLKSARESQDLSIEQVEAELRISADLLAALEDDRFDGLVPVFAKGYLKQYGAMLGLDVAELLAQYNSMVGESSVNIRPSTEAAFRHRRSVAPWIIAGLVLGVAVAFVWWWFALGPGSNQV